MDTSAAETLDRTAAKISKALCWLTILTAASALVIWLFCSPTSTHLKLTMKANSAFGIACAGISLLLLIGDPKKITLRQRKTAQTLSGFVFLIGLLTLVEYATKLSFGIDQVLAPDHTVALTQLPGRMSPIAAICFALLGFAVLLIDAPYQTRRHWPTILSLPVFFICLLAIVGYIFGAQAFYQIGNYVQIAWQTAVCLAILSIVLIISRPQVGLADIILSPTLGGVIARKMLPISIFVPILLGWLRIEGVRTGMAGVALGGAIIIVAFIVLFSSMILLNARDLVILDKNRKASEQQLLQYVQQSPYAVAMFDRNLRYLLTSQKWLEEYKMSFDQVRGRSHYDFFPELPEHWKEIHRKCLSGSIIKCDGEPFYRANGSIDWVRWEVRPWYDVEGQIGGMLIFFENITERKLNELKRKENEMIYQAIGESIDYGIWICTPEGHNTYVSDSFLKLVGLTQEEYSKLGWEGVFHPDDAERTMATWKECMRTRQKLNVQYRCLGADKAWHPILALGSPVRNDKGEVICWAGINLDMREMKESEEALRQNEIKFRRIFDSNLVGLIYWREDGTIADANEAFLKSVGYSNEDLANGHLNWRQMTPVEWSNLDKHALLELKTKSVCNPYEKEFFKKDGSRVPVVIGGATIEGVSDIAGIAYVLDISERKMIERERDKIYAELAKSEKSYRLTVESLQDHAICLLDPSGKVLSWNAAAERVKGYKGEEIIGRNFSLFYLPEDIKAGIPQRALEIAAATGKYSEEALRVRKDGTLYWASVVISAIRDEKDALKGFVKVSQDITRRKNDARALMEAKDSLEIRVQERTQELARSNAELEQFAYITSHDLREPLRTVTNYAQLLEERYKGNLDSAADKFIGYIVEGASRMDALISDLLSYSRVGKADLAVGSVDMNEVAQIAIQNLAAAIAESEANIKVDPLPTIQANQFLMLQLLQNLLSNAIKFHKAHVKPEVHISVESQGHQWLFRVADNGIGIEPQYAKRIFVIFQRLHTREEYSGTGIGLAVCKKIVERYGGRIWMESELNKGSIFYFTIHDQPHTAEATAGGLSA